MEVVRDLLVGRVRALGECGEVWVEIGSSQFGWGEFSSFLPLEFPITNPSLLRRYEITPSLPIQLPIL